jgi:hypothetical protein
MALRKKRTRKGGRGIKAPYKSPPIRCPEPIREEVQGLIDLYVKSGLSENPPLLEDSMPEGGEIHGVEGCTGLFTAFHVIRFILSINEEPESPPAPSC